MIARIEGVLESVEGTAALLRLAGGLTYEVMLPASTAARLGDAIGQTLTLHTLHFVEAQGQGTTLLPRLAGFLSTTDREFYQLFIDCKGLGRRRALRAMTLPVEQIAAAIADRDVALLQSLPEIGRRTADTIVATLTGKVDRFISAAAYPTSPSSSSTTPAGGMAREALEVLLQLGENRIQATTWIDQALRDQGDRPRDVQALVAKVYRIKSGA